MGFARRELCLWRQTGNVCGGCSGNLSVFVYGIEDVNDKKRQVCYKLGVCN